MGAGVLSNFSGRASARSDDTMDADGDSVYLVFGADTSSTGLDSWVEKHKGDIKKKSQQSSSSVIQYQDVTQLNVNQQKNAVAISIDGGDAEAIQNTYQNNQNTQAGSAQSINARKKRKKQKFKGVKNVYVIFAEQTNSREFSGWVVSDDAYESTQTAEATINQKQKVEQFNYNSQSTAVAIAKDSSYSRAYQRSYQQNKNVQTADAVAANVGAGDSQNAESSVIQSQKVSQLNVNEQGVAVAIAVGRDSVAKAWQISCQFNVNKQLADATAINFDPKSIQEVTASAKIAGDLSEKDMTQTKDGSKQSNKTKPKDKSKQSNSQVASANIEQVQCVGQQNINMQNAAVAVALDDSQATATQASYQANFNAQVAEATALNVEDSHQKVRKVMSGKNMNGDDSWAVSYDNGNAQTATVDISQLQIVNQLNVNEQFSAIAVAKHCGNATAEQLNYQVNENIQVAEATAVNKGDGKKNDKRKKKDGKKKKKKCDEKGKPSSYGDLLRARF